MYDFQYPSNGDTALGYVIRVRCARNAFTWLSALGVVACLRAVVLGPTYACVVIKGLQRRSIYVGGHPHFSFYNSATRHPSKLPCAFA